MITIQITNNFFLLTKCQDLKGTGNGLQRRKYVTMYKKICHMISVG